jgi:hypothetical protein
MLPPCLIGQFIRVHTPLQIDTPAHGTCKLAKGSRTKVGCPLHHTWSEDGQHRVALGPGGPLPLVRTTEDRVC